jgi:hypothetical protein
MAEPENLAGRALSTGILSAATRSQRVLVEHKVSEGEKPAAPGRDPREQARHFFDVGVVVFWLAVLALGTYIYLRNDKAQVLLNVSAADSITVSGMVVANGHPVENGIVHVVVNDALNERYLTSDVVEIQKEGGSFSRVLLSGTGRNLSGERFEVIATYSGDLRAADGDQSPVTGAASAYLNMEKPLQRASVAWVGGLSLFVLLMLIVLFTGELTAPKARALFAATYLMTFMSLAIPIAVAVLLTSNESLVDTMRKAPIGLVKATTENVGDEQWMLNVGGTVTAVALPAPPPGVPAAREEQAGGSAAAGAAAPNTRPGELSASLAGPVRIVGGLAVPFYILMLAMLGAGINMTRQVPKVQTIYDQKITPRCESFLIATLSALFQYQTVADKDEREAAAVIRKQLIDSYMYLLAAPFLAIAVYYLLQVIADDTAEPILVLMAFATGLISDAVVSRITDFAENTIGRLPARQGSGSEPPPAAQPSASGQQSASVHAPESGAGSTAAPAAAPESPVGAGSVVSQATAEGRENAAERVMAALVAKVENASTNPPDPPVRPSTDGK